MSDSEIAARLAFARIDDEIRKALPDVWTIIKPSLPKVLAGFYTHLATVPSLSVMVGSREPALISAQTRHWEMLFSGRFDDTYSASIRRIGLTHHRIGLEPRWYIGGYAFVLRELTSVIAAAAPFNARKTAKRIAAASAAIMLDMDYAISVYQEVLLEERQRRGETLNRAIEDFSAAVTKVFVEAEEASSVLQNSAGVMSDIATNVRQLTREISHNTATTASNMQTGAAATEEMSISVREIGGEAKKSADIAQQATATAEQTNTSIAGLSERAREIGHVVGLISDIAAQTNLLALNATIEAARAGEAGRGFAVVAQEVKELASQTAKATAEISERIGSIQEETNRSVEDIQAIALTIAKVSESAVAIAGAVDQQATATTDIARTVQETASLTQNVSDRMTELDASTERAAAAAAQVSQARLSLNEQLRRLREETDAFLAAAQAA